MEENVTFLITVDLSDEDPAFVDELGGDLVGGLVPDGRQHVAEAAPVGVKIDENEFVFR